MIASPRAWEICRCSVHARLFSGPARQRQRQSLGCELWQARDLGRLEFIRTSWRNGSSGAFWVGLKYSLVCVGSSRLLFILLFPLGLMNLAAMGLLTALILAEKCFSSGIRVVRVAALMLILYGVLVMIVPTALPSGSTGM